MMTSRICRGLCCGVLLLAIAGTKAQTLTVNTPAGYGGQGTNDGTGSSARFNSPCGVAADSAGNVYVADTANHVIRMLNSAGLSSTLAGVAGVAGTNDGPASSARFNLPRGIAVDANGVVYVADSGNNTIRKIAGGMVSTLAGSAGTNGLADGTGAGAQLNQPQGLAVDGVGNVYVADTLNHTLRKVTASGVVSTLAGTAGVRGTADGTNQAAHFNWPTGVALDASGNVYVADAFNHSVRKVAAAGTNWVTTSVAGLSGVWGSTDSTNTSARFFTPQGIAADAAGYLYVAEAGNQTIREIAPNGAVTTLAGSFGIEGSADGVGAAARFRGPQGIAVSGSTLYVADTGNGTIRKMSSAGAVSTLAGSPSIGIGDGAGGNARFFWPAGAAADAAGNVYVSDSENSTIRKVTSAGEVSTLAGQAGASGSQNGTGTGAQFSAPQGLAVDAAGNVYVADMGNHAIRRISSSGAVTTLAGVAGTSGSKDGPAGSALFYGPQGVAVDTQGNVYVADTWNHTIRLITPAGNVSTVAGVAGSYGAVDGPTNTARFYEPRALAVDATGRLYVADFGNQTIRVVSPAGMVSTLAGAAGIYGSADLTGTNALFYGPCGVVPDGAGNAYVADYFNQTVRRVTAAGVVTTVAGATTLPGSSDGTSSAARFYAPAAITAVGAAGFYVADLGNNTLRLGMLSANGAPLIITQPQSQTIDLTSNATFSVLASGTALTYQWRFNAGAVTGATASSYSRPSVQGSDAGSYSVVISNAQGSVTSVDALLVVDGAPVFTQQPQTEVVPVGQIALFIAAASGAQPLAYQWRFGGNTISGATDAVYTLASVSDTNAGSYSVLVSNRFGLAASSNAVLIVATLPQVWGDASWGQTDVPFTAGNALAVSAGAWHNLALLADGLVVGWGNDSSGQCDAPPSLTDALAIAAGGYHSLAIRANGTVVAWGDNFYGQATVPPGLAGVIGVAAGTWHSLALKSDGTVVAWGDNSYGQCRVPPGLSNVVSVAAGGSHTLALLASRQVVGWGENTDAQGYYAGQATPPLGLTNVVAIAAGEYHSLAVLGNGHVVAWGDNSDGQCAVPVDLTNAVAAAGGGLHSLALQADGRLVAWGANWNGQCNVPALTNVFGLGAGEAHSLALLAGPVPAARLWNATWQAGRFQALAQTLYRHNYALDTKSPLGAANWTALLTNAGNGALELLSDPNATGPQGFYRERQW